MQSASAVEASALDGALDTVHADTLRFFPELVRELGGDPVSLVAELDFMPAAISNGLPAGYRAIATLMEHAAQRLRCPDFGLRLASLQGGGAVFGAFREVLAHAPTLGDGLRCVADNSHAHSASARVRMQADRHTGATLVSHDVLVDGLPIKRQMVEQFLLLAHLNATEVSGAKARVRQVRFRFQPVSPSSTYRMYFGCDVLFDQSVDGVVFNALDLECATVASDPRLFDAAKALVTSQYCVRPPLQVQVRALIVQLIERDGCSKERIAAELHMHPRTLHRRLLDEGTCFEDIKDSVRRDAALGYLRATSLPMRRIAEKVGYAEQSVLARSCSRWFDASPRAIRKMR
jgi:AraC-like DNA-binding protein